MSFQPVDLGTAPNDNTGDPLREAGEKINENFAELYALYAAVMVTASIFGTPRASYAELAALTTFPNGTRATVIASDSGNHPPVAGDVGVVSGNTPNAGLYEYVVALSAWKRLGNTDAQDSAAAKALSEAARDIAIANGQLITQAVTTDPNFAGRIAFADPNGVPILNALVPDPRVDALASANASQSTGYTTDPALAGKIVYVDGYGRLVGVVGQDSYAAIQAQISAAAGSRVDIDARLDQSLTEYGNPKGPYIKPWALRRFRRDWASLFYGYDAPVVRPTIALVGDSYSTSAYYWAYWLKMRLDQLSGRNGGLGWFGFGDPGGGIGINGNVYTGPGETVVAKTGSGWASNYGTATAHSSICDAYSSTVADRHTITVSRTARPILSAVKLHYKGGEGGVVRYRWNGGAWTTLALTGSGTQIVDLAGFPTTTAGFTFDIEVDPTNAGTSRLYGVDFQSAILGPVFHKLGATGRRVRDHALASATVDFRASLAALNPTQIFIEGPINDRNSGIPPADYAIDCQTYITNARLAAPGVEVLLWFPAEIIGAAGGTPGINNYPFPNHMREYRKACEPLLEANDSVAIFDVQPLLPGNGDPTFYNSASSFPFLHSDGVHPSNPFGARVIEEGMTRLLAY